MTLLKKTMHENVRNYVQKIKGMYPDRFRNVSVLEVWSQNINGSVRAFFDDCEYTWLDLCEWKDVDIVLHVTNFWPDKEYDVVISTEAMEHDKLWAMSLYRMWQLVKKRGMLLVTCANINRKEHGTTRTSPKNSPWTLDYYRNISREDVLSILPNAIIVESPDKTDIYFHILKL